MQGLYKKSHAPPPKLTTSDQIPNDLLDDYEGSANGIRKRAFFL